MYIFLKEIKIFVLFKNYSRVRVFIFYSLLKSFEKTNVINDCVLVDLIVKNKTS